MDEKKDESRISERSKINLKVDPLKKPFLCPKNLRAKTSLKKVGRSRTQKGHKNY